MTKLKINLIPIIIFSCIFIWITFESVNYLKFYSNHRKQYTDFQQYCQEQPHDSMHEYVRKECENLKEYEPYQTDVVNAFFQNKISSTLRMLDLVTPFLIIIMTIWVIHSKFKSGYLKNLLLREKYSKIVFKEIVKSYAFVLVIPISLITSFFILYIITGTFDPSYALKQDTTYVSDLFLETPIYFLTFYTISLFLYNLFIANIALFFANKGINKILAIFASFITFFILGLCFEVIIFTILAITFKNFMIPELLFYSFWNYESSSTILFEFGYSLFLFLSSLIIVLMSYNNKEKVIIQNEK
ncbi:MAG: hypothetical protein PHI05_01705 [Bacilli bacterium]|nr:hypothetical protein [Bacilli bacterium]MDD4547443.1 hypothetical protein [Bacilli bacterium]